MLIGKPMLHQELASVLRRCDRLTRADQDVARFARLLYHSLDPGGHFRSPGNPQGSYYMRHSKAFNTGVGLVTCVCVLTVFTLPAGAASIIFKKVDTFTTEGTEEKKHDARLELDTEKRLLLVVDEKRGAEKMTYAAIPYDAVT